MNQQKQQRHPHYPLNPYRVHSLMHKPSLRAQLQQQQKQEHELQACNTVEGYQSSANICPIRPNSQLVSSKHKQCVYTSGTRVYKFRSEV